MPGFHSHLGYSSRLLARCERGEVRTNVDIHTLLQRIVDNEAKHSRHSCFLWLGTDLLTCLRELRDETRTGRECGKRDECTLHTYILVLSRWECKPGITCNNFMVSFARQTTHSMYHLPQHEHCLSILYICSKIYSKHIWCNAMRPSTIQYMDRWSCISPIEFLRVKT